MINLQKIYTAKNREVLKIENDIFAISNESDFEAACMAVFRYQAKENTVYKNWIKHLKIAVDSVKRIEDIPFLPITFFKQQKVLCGPETKQTVVFTSSSTTGQVPSKHYVNKVELYTHSYFKTFTQFYGDVKELVVLALLPNYLQRQGSSLVYMVKDLIERSGDEDSGFYLDDLDALKQKINALKVKQKKVLLIGVSYALLDLCEKDVQLGDQFIVMETGGMKGRRAEMIKEAMHEALKQGLGVKEIHSEYGMTELLSQAYSRGDGIFEAPPWMRFMIREIDDPLQLQRAGKTGGINVIDLANIYSCSFIATQDLGKINEKKQLQLMGRFDHSDVRGCNLMVAGL